MLENLDLTDPNVVAHPHATYDRLRNERPVHWNRSLNGWVVTRHGDVRDVLRHPQFSVEKLEPFVAHMTGDKAAGVEALGRILSDWMVFKDPPRHTNLRRALKNAFMPRDIEKMRPMVRAVVDELLDDFAGDGRIDLVTDFGFPLPATVIGDLFGVPRDRIAPLKQWSDDLGRFVLNSIDSRGKYERAGRAAQEMTELFREVLEDHRENPRDDVTSLMLRDGDGVLTDDEMVHTMVLALWAGHETTTNLVANGMLALIDHPAQLARLQADPSLIPSAVEEFLRWEGPAQMLVRLAKQDVEVAGVTVKQGQRVFVATNAANRDPAMFDHPEEFDVGRAKNRHVAFGHGIHLCLGAPLARLEGHVAFDRLLARFTDFRLEVDAPEWRDQIIMRGPVSLPMSLKRRAT